MKYDKLNETGRSTQLSCDEFPFSFWFLYLYNCLLASLFHLPYLVAVLLLVHAFPQPFFRLQVATTNSISFHEEERRLASTKALVLPTQTIPRVQWSIQLLFCTYNKNFSSWANYMRLLAVWTTEPIVDSLFLSAYTRGSLWGTGGVLYILFKAIIRVLPIALEPFKKGGDVVPLSQFQLGYVREIMNKPTDLII